MQTGGSSAPLNLNAHKSDCSTFTYAVTVAGVSELVLIGIHTDPDSVVEEMEALVDVHAAVERRWNTDNILIMGDLNADCNYASGRARERLTLRTDLRFTWLIHDDVDTTTTRSHCAYDRCVSAWSKTPRIQSILAAIC